jgi:hypothetical protein
MLAHLRLGVRRNAFSITTEAAAADLVGGTVRRPLPPLVVPPLRQHGRAEKPAAKRVRGAGRARR